MRFRRVAIVGLLLATQVAAQTITVGYGHVPPLTYKTAAGKAAGFAVDVMEEAARREGLHLNWRPVGSSLEQERDLANGRVDLLPVGMATSERRGRFFVSPPWWFAELFFVTPTGSDIPDVTGRRIERIAVNTPVYNSIIRSHLGGDVKIVLPGDGPSPGAHAVCTGQAAAALMSLAEIRSLLRSRPDACGEMEFETHEANISVPLAIVARQQRADIGRRLRHQIDVITEDGTLAKLAAKHPSVPTRSAVYLTESLRAGHQRTQLRMLLGGAVLLLLVSMGFIANQRRAQAALRRSRDEMRFFIDSMPVGVWIVDREGKVAGHNAAALEVWGAGPEVARKGFGEYTGWHPDTGKRLAAEEWAGARAVLKGERVLNELVEIQPFDGKPYKFILNSAAPLLDENGGITGAIITNQDVTDRMRAQQSLQESERRYRAFFEQASVGTTLVDTSTGNFIDINEKFCEITGYARDEVVGRTFRELTHPDDREADFQRYTDFVQGIRPDYRSEKRYVRKDGETIWIRVEAGAVRNTAGDIAYTIGIVQDITEEKRAAEALRESQIALEELNRALKWSNEELQQFAYIASHDLQEPLRTIRGCTQLIAKKVQPMVAPEDRELMDFVISAGERLGRMISDLLEYSRVERGFEAVRTEVPLEEAFAGALSNLQHAIQARNAEVMHEPLPVVLGDYGRLEQLLQNLIGNAIKYVPADKTPLVHVKAAKREDQWLISVRDNGVGIDPRHRERIFGVFKRLHGHEIPGTGMGLAIAKKIVERHGGRLWVDSEPGTGSTFCFTLPGRSAEPRRA